MFSKNYKVLPFIVYFCLLPALVSLGIWQLNRVEEKREIIKHQEERQHSDPIRLTEDSTVNFEAILYNQVNIIGYFDTSHQFLLDNQVLDGKAGYFVLTPFLLKNQDKGVLVNRGWIPVGRNRSELPNISVITDEISLNGKINHFPKPGIILDGAEIPSKTWPATLQVIDTKVLDKLLGYPLYDFQVELDKSAPYGFKREWQQKQTMPPEKHLAYAGQWFLLALLLTVLYIKYGFNKNE